MENLFKPYLSSFYSNFRSLFGPESSSPFFPWQDAVWSQRLQFQNLLAILRANKNWLFFDAERLKNFDDFQRQVPIMEAPQSPADSGQSWVYPDNLLIDSFASRELATLIRESIRFSRKPTILSRAKLTRPVLVFDLPWSASFHRNPDPRVAKKKARFTKPDIDYLSALALNAGEISRELHTIAELIQKKTYRGIVALTSDLQALGIPFPFGKNSWIRKVMPSLDFVITDQPLPKNQTKGVAWIEILTTQGMIWARFQRDCKQVKGLARAGLFWEFLSPDTPCELRHPKRWWLGNVPLGEPVELVISSCHGLLAQRTGMILSVIDRRKAMFERLQQRNIFNDSSHPEFQTIPHGDHQSKFDKGGGWQGISHRNSS